MSEQEISDFSKNMFVLFEKRSKNLTKKDSLLDNKGKPFIGREQEVLILIDEIEQVEKLIKDKLKNWFQEEKIKLEKPTQPKDILIESTFEVILSATHYDSKKGIHVRVPVGQIFVVGSSSEPIDLHGFPEVYLSGEFIDKKESNDTWIIALAEYSGLIKVNAQHLLAGISVTDEDLARAYFTIPTCVADPIMMVKRSGKKWLTELGQKEINNMIGEELERHISQIMYDGQIYLWTDDSHNVLNFIFAAIEKNLKQWGLTINIDAISFIRNYPTAIYKIVLELIAVEKLIVNLQMQQENEKHLKRTGLSEDQLAKIKILSNQDQTVGKLLFSAIQMMDQTKRAMLVNWLDEINKNNLADFILSVYSNHNSEIEIKLSEQIIHHAIRNPVLCSGEGLEINYDWVSYYSILQAELNLVQA